MVEGETCYHCGFRLPFSGANIAVLIAETLGAIVENEQTGGIALPPLFFTLTTGDLYLLEGCNYAHFMDAFGFAPDGEGIDRFVKIKRSDGLFADERLQTHLRRFLVHLNAALAGRQAGRAARET